MIKIVPIDLPDFIRSLHQILNETGGFHQTDTSFSPPYLLTESTQDFAFSMRHVYHLYQEVAPDRYLLIYRIDEESIQC